MEKKVDERRLVVQSSIYIVEWVGEGTAAVLNAFHWTIMICVYGGTLRVIIRWLRCARRSARDRHGRGAGRGDVVRGRHKRPAELRELALNDWRML